MKRQLRRIGLLCLMIATTLMAGAATTAKWDFKNNIPEGIQASTNYQGVEADIESDVSGIFMHVNATNGKLYCVDRTNAQMNPGTVLQVPVTSNEDVVTVEGFPNYCHFAVGGEENVDGNIVAHTATAAEVRAGYVEITATAGNNYINTISVVQMKDAVVAEDITATWDYSNSDVMAETIALSGSTSEGTVKAIEDNGVLMTVAANGATFRNNGNNIQVRKGAVFKVPVKSTEDVITVRGYPNYSYYTIGNSEEIRNTGENPSTTYTAKSGDVSQGYVAITSTNDNNYFYSISVVQKAQQEKPVLTDVAATATFPFNLGTEGQVADFGDAADYFINSKVVYGDGLFLKDAKSDAGFDQTRFEPYTQNNTPDASNVIQFLIQPKYGLAFTPTEVSFKTTRYGTDNGLLDIAWLNPDGTTVTLATEVKPNRNSGTNPAIASEEGKKYSDLSYTVSGATPEEGACGLQINLYRLQNGKQIGFADIVIKGLLNGQEVEVPMLESLTANGVKYYADDVFEADGERFVATIELSKAEEMISQTNPVTDVTAITGEIGEITYNGDATKCEVTIPVQLGSISINYVANFVQKSDFTLTYVDTDGSIMGTQSVEKDAPIGSFAVDYNNAKAAEGEKVRGWFVKNYYGQKYTTEDIVTSDISLYAVATEIETPSSYKKYNFDLTDKLFYPEDHEAFVPVGSGYWHDAQHGWAFHNGDRIELLVGTKAFVYVTNCRYGSETAQLVFKDAQGNEVGRIPARTEGDGEINAFQYEGAEGKLYIDVEAGGEIYIHSVRIVNSAESSYANVGNWYFVKPGEASSLLEVLDVVNGINSSRDAERTYIFLPNGTYDLKQTVLTAISGHNISLIGQSTEGAIIKNAPDYHDESIGNTAVLLNSSQNLYMQDITLQNALDYYATQPAGLEGGRAVCFQDRGDRAIFKNVTMLSYQDTYYSQNTKQSYWETCDVHGTVDFLCGGGDVRFVNTKLSLEPRTKEGTGARTITAPTTTTDFGYVFDNCEVIDLANGKGEWNFGRTWQNYPIAIYLNTKLDKNAEKTLIGTRWIEKGMNSKDPKVFGEYDTVNEAGDNITPSSNIIISYNGQFETILTAEEANSYSYDKMFKNNANAWDPASLTLQKEAPTATFANGTLTWSPVDGAIAYAIFNNNVFVGLVESGTTTFDLEAAEGDIITIRSANEMGGLGEAASIEVTTTEASVNDYDTEAPAPGEYATITTDRQLLKGLNTIVLPFSTDKEELGANKVLKYDGTIERNGMLYLHFSEVESLDANTPYAVFVDNDKALTSFTDKTVVAADELTVSDSEYNFVGTYCVFENGASPIVEGDMIAGVSEFVKANGGNKLRAYRAYMKKVGTSEAGVGFIFGDEVIDGIEATRLMDTMSGNDIFNLNGQRVQRTQKGVYIINGKKTVVK